VIRILLAILALSILVPGSVRAEDLAPGARVRVTLLEQPDSPRLIGTIRSLPPDALELTTAPDSPATTISRLQIARVEVSRGMKSRAGHGAVTGALIVGLAGAAGGLILGSAIREGDSSTDELVGIGFAGGGLIGAVLGAAIGSGSRAESWETVKLP
jgi:hypothetical protein